MGAAGLGTRMAMSKTSIISNLSLFYILDRMFNKRRRKTKNIIYIDEEDLSPIYSLNAVNIDGYNISLDHYKGKVLLVVNLGRHSKHIE
jgi:hypothetical protein